MATQDCSAEGVSVKQSRLTGQSSLQSVGAPGGGHVNAPRPEEAATTSSQGGSGTRLAELTVQQATSVVERVAS